MKMPRMMHALGPWVAAAVLHSFVAHGQTPVVQQPVTPKETGQNTRDIPQSQPWKPGDPVREVPDLKRTTGATSPFRGPVAPHVLINLRALPVLPRWPEGRSVQIVPMAGSATHHKLKVADGVFAIYDDSGALAAGPFPFESLWRDPGACRTPSSDALTAFYDSVAKRWLLSRWRTPAPQSAFILCVAVSRNADPIAGGWFLYDFVLPMYRRGTAIEAAPDGYFLTIDSSAQTAFVFDRKRLLEGAPVEPAQTLPDKQRSKR